ncbi:MAG: thioredoxin domain-containing protein [Actinobacteria bacterium]|nr:thioredoxin domain-containing protein [Actinomycetota bacterium]
MNRLKDSTSPYLLQHADNPVDWWPWCDEAFAEAARRDVPVLLSVGYAACHWCHVMAHESFEDAETAALLNEHMVAVKVDREERPDVDAVYMTATQAMTGQGGWPMTVFMTPDREPFFAGTYFPRDYFRQLVVNVARAWRAQRDGVTGQARQVAAALAQNASATARVLREAAVPEGSQPRRATDARFREVADAAAAGLGDDYDVVEGGFGGAPKFPPSMVLEFLLRYHQRTGSDDALRMAEGTCEAMARGGMYDQLGGGFARYSTDAAWVVPHFEKMLYDNALLARVYLNLWRRTGSELGRRVAEETCEAMLRELGTAEGGLAASLDADSEGEEGKFYVWRPDELRAVLGPGDGEFAAEMFGVTGAGTFERGASVLQRRTEPAGPADAGRLARIRAALLAARARRVRPGRDDKVVAAWNGLAVCGLAECGLLLGRPEFVAAARGAAELLARLHLAGGRLVRTSRGGVAGTTPGALDDYACVADGFLTLSGVTGEPRWVTLAGQLLETALGSFGDGQGGFYDTAADGEPLIFRPADPADNATPSGTFAVSGALLGYSALTGSARHRAAAEAALGVLPGIAARYPRAAGAGLAVAEAWLAGPAEIAVVGDPRDDRTRALHQAALHAAPPGAVLALGDGTRASAGDGGVPLLAGRGLVDGAPAAYVCRQFTCRAPVTTPEQLREVLAAPV